MTKALTIENLLGNFNPGDILNINHESETGFVVLKPFNIFKEYDMLRVINLHMSEGVKEYSIGEYLVTMRNLNKSSSEDQPIPRAKLPLVVLTDDSPSQLQIGEFSVQFPWFMEAIATQSKLLSEKYLHPLVVLKHVVKAYHLGTPVRVPGASQVSLGMLLKAIEDFEAPHGKLHMLGQTFKADSINEIGMMAGMAIAAVKEDEIIAKNGYSVNGVFNNETGINFVVTRELSKLSGFEFIMNGALNVSVMRDLVDIAVDQWVKKNFDPSTYGEELRLGYVRDPVKDASVAIRCAYAEITKDKLPEIIDMYFKRASTPVTKVFQILFADKNNILPGEPGYDESFNQTL